MNLLFLAGAIGRERGNEPESSLSGSQLGDGFYSVHSVSHSLHPSHSALASSSPGVSSLRARLPALGRRLAECSAEFEECQEARAALSALRAQRERERDLPLKKHNFSQLLG